MPTYEYRCPEGHEFERIQKITDPSRARCQRCGRLASRLISGGAGLIFKGSGFYITDYGKDGKGRPKDAEATPAAPASGSEAAPTPPKPDSGGKTAKAEKTEKSEKKSGRKRTSS
ncbi:MAG TPA: zinc ribbon domain-containing protein [Gemmatimonadales bacterium]|nr:zinc ribbon domain-containing protein [Gemmatimonadales bacterium]